MTAVPIKDVAQLVGGNASFLSIDRQEYAARMDPVFVIASVFLVDTMFGEEAGQAAGNGTSNGYPLACDVTGQKRASPTGTL